MTYTVIKDYFIKKLGIKVFKYSLNVALVNFLIKKNQFGTSNNIIATVIEHVTATNEN